MKKVYTRMVEADHDVGLCHQRSLGFCSRNVETVAFHCTMICVIDDYAKDGGLYPNTPKDQLSTP